jgi:hypothetical protein
VEQKLHSHIGLHPQVPHTFPATRPFLLMEGGPLFRIERRVGLIKSNAPFTIRRAILAACCTWLVLLILSALQGTAFGNTVNMPFLHDFSTYSRFLLGVPLLLVAELVLGPRIAEAAEHFLLAGIVKRGDFQAFDQAVESSLRLRDSIVAEVAIAVLSYIVSFYASQRLAVSTSTWHSIPSATGGFTRTWAGWWLILFCTPLMHFLVFRWLWRIFLWFRFLSKVSRLNLQLFPTHPDQAGGLGFVGDAQRFFGILVFAYSCGITGVVANQVLYGKIPLQHFAASIGAYAVFVLILTTAPLIVFAGKLLATKREGLLEYGALSTAYSGSFHHKWIQDDRSQQEELLGSADIQSLADLGNSYEFIERMKPIPIDPRSLIHLIVAALLPMATLLLTVMPFKDVVKLLMKVVM